MNENTPIALVLFAVSAVLYAFIGWRLSQKTYADPDSARAWTGFRTWWYGMAANNVVTFFAILLFVAGVTNLSLHVAFKILNIVLPSLALWGLLSYLVYVFTGSQRARTVLTVFYVAFAVALVFGIIALQPISVRQEAWSIELNNAVVATDLGTGAAIAIFLSFILSIALPPVIAAIGFFMLFFRVKERSQKYRSIMVPAGIMILFGLSILVPLLLIPFGIQIAQVSWWPVTIRVLGVLALIMIYWAYYPPAFIQRSLQVAPLT